MAIRIEIKDDDVNDLIAFYSTKQKYIREQIIKLEKDLKDVSATIAQLKQRPSNSPSSFTAGLISDKEVFSAKWPWLRKITYAINEAGKPITTKEIVEILELYEPKSEDERKSAISSVSSTLSVKSGKFSDRRDFVKSVTDSGEFAYNIWKEDEDPEKNSYSHGSQIIMDDLPF